LCQEEKNDNVPLAHSSEGLKELIGTHQTINWIFADKEPISGVDEEDTM